MTQCLGGVDDQDYWRNTGISDYDATNIVVQSCLSVLLHSVRQVYTASQNERLVTKMLNRYGPGHADEKYGPCKGDINTDATRKLSLSSRPSEVPGSTLSQDSNYRKWVLSSIYSVAPKFGSSTSDVVTISSCAVLQSKSFTNQYKQLQSFS